MPVTTAPICFGLQGRIVIVTGAGGLETANAGGNVEGIAKIIFGTYVFAFELTAALLMVAALAAIVGVVAFAAIFGLGETMMQSTIPAMVNDLADDHTRGRANSVNSAAFQLGAIAGPVMAGVVLHDGHWLLFVAILVLGCVLVAASAFGIERIVSPAVNGLREDAAQAGAEIPHVPVHD